MREGNACGNQNVIQIKKSTRLPALWQAYSTLYYQSKLKPLVDDAYNKYLDGLKKDNVVSDDEGNEPAKSRKSWLEFQNEIAKAEFEKATDEVKAEVAQYCERLKKKDEPVREPLPGHYQRLVKRW